MQLFSASGHTCTSTFCFLVSPVDRRTLLTQSLPAFMLLLLSLRPAAAQQKYLSNTRVRTRQGNPTQFRPPHTQTSSLYIALDSSSRSAVKTEEGVADMQTRREEFQPKRTNEGATSIRPFTSTHQQPGPACSSAQTCTCPLLWVCDERDTYRSPSKTRAGKSVRHNWSPETESLEVLQVF